MTELVNPYGRSTTIGKKYIQCRIGLDDFVFFHKCFSYGKWGITDIVFSILFKRLIDELRRIDSENELEAGWYIDHPNYAILSDILDRFQVVERRPVGVDSAGGATPAQHDAGRIDGFRAEVQPIKKQRTVKKGSDKTRKRHRKGTTKEEV